MKEFLIITVSFFILLLLFNAANIKGQFTFAEPDSGLNYDITGPCESICFVWGDYNDYEDVDFLFC